MLYFTWNSLCCPSRNVQLCQYIAKGLCIFEFQLVSFAFRLIFGDPFIVFPSPTQKKNFHGTTNFVGQIYRGIVLNGGLFIRSYQEGGCFTKCIFQ